MGIWLDGMMGLVVGDALGVPVQFISRKEIANRPGGPVTGMESGGVFNMDKGTWSDDSSMALATLSSIISKGEADPADIMLQFEKWLLQGEYTPFGVAFDEGNTCVKAIRNFVRDRDIGTCGVTGEYANGNGALMRILPACLYYCSRQEEASAGLQDILRNIHIISGLTHNHRRANMCSGMYYFMVRGIVEKRGEPVKEKLTDILRKSCGEWMEYYSREPGSLSEMAHFKRMNDLDELAAVPESGIRSSGYVIDSMEAALWCLITTDSFRDCLLKAVNLGDDADTVAAIAGGLAGLYYGYDEIPSEWLGCIKRRKWIEQMCEDAEKLCPGGEKEVR